MWKGEKVSNTAAAIGQGHGFVETSQENQYANDNGNTDENVPIKLLAQKHG